MLSAYPYPSRRQVLTGAGRVAAGVLAAAVTGAGASACGTSEPPKVDDLEAELSLARDDSELARAAAAAAPQAIAPTLTQVASERSEHARALAEEIARAAGRPAPTSESTTTTTTASTGPSGSAAPPPSVKDVTTALHRSADSAAQLAPTLSGYRAGLLGSIAASCTAAYTVALAS